MPIQDNSDGSNSVRTEVVDMCIFKGGENAVGDVNSRLMAVQLDKAADGLP